MKQFFLALLFFMPMSVNAAQISKCEVLGTNGACTLYGVSIVELLANPTKYDGKRVRIIGFLNLEFEGNAIYLHQDDALHSITANGLWVEIANNVRQQTNQNCKSKNYALLEGRFAATNRGHGGAWSSAIVDVTRCSIWK